MASRIPPLLEPYLALPPEASLILFTSVLGASSNWLVLRALHSALLGSEISSEDGPKVLLVSFMRDLAFWKENGRRLGLDLEKLAAKKRFAFLDGLSGLFFPGTKSQKGAITNSALESVFEAIKSEILVLKSQAGSKVLVIIDQMDLLLAAGGDGINAVNLGEMVVGLREEAHAMVLSLSADYPLVTSHQTALEADHAAFLLGVAHQADLNMSLRLLDSGTARDVSGVVRITVGDRGAEDIQHSHKKLEDRELLYFVGGDGGVKVFERGQ